jgi:hypothetical protein
MKVKPLLLLEPHKASIQILHTKNKQIGRDKVSLSKTFPTSKRDSELPIYIKRVGDSSKTSHNPSEKLVGKTHL